MTYTPMVLDRVRRVELLEPGEELIDAVPAHLGRPVHQPGGFLTIILVAGAAGFAVGFTLRPFGILPGEVGAAVGFIAGIVLSHRFVERRYGREVLVASLPWIALVRTSKRLLVIDYPALRRGETRLLRSAALTSISGVSFAVRKAFGVLPMSATVTIRASGDPDIDVSRSVPIANLYALVEGLGPEGKGRS